ncbi:MAG: hypothetical protein PUP93_20935 [Rhizonema sp. NSF051]|nr:hypothetical protein [Rhizonema sp. NSF051]
MKYQVTKGTVAEIRDRTLRVLKGCGVEMLIIDETERFKPILSSTSAGGRSFSMIIIWLSLCLLTK